MNHPPLDVAYSAAVAANRQRAAALIAVSDPAAAMSVTGVISAACIPSGRPLRRITLRQLLLAQQGWSSDRVGKTLERTVASLEIESIDLRRLTIAWLLDPRAGGTRFMAFCDALHHRTAGPWDGFPFAPKSKALRDTRTR